MRHGYTEPSFLEIAQQDVIQWLPESDRNAHLEHALARACLTHCIAAAGEMKGFIPSFDHFEDYIKFLLENGAHHESGSSNHEIYDEEHGWRNVPLANLLRLRGDRVILQNLKYHNVDYQAAAEVGRISTHDEARILARLRHYGGERRKWLGAIGDTLHHGGVPIVSINIPLLKRKDDGTDSGRHSVVVTALDHEYVTYFDPDRFAIDRYQNNGKNPHIVRIDKDQLFYRQPLQDFLNRMTGEVMHIDPTKDQFTLSEAS